MASGIVWAVDNGARVINMSLGGSSGSKAVEDAVNYAWGKGAVLVAAAGNSGSDTPTYPAAYEKVIAVAATDSTDAKASWSNWGSWVDLAAPGVEILSTAPDHRTRLWPRPPLYATLSGTSMASPHVAGAAGLVWASGYCSTSADQPACVRSRLEETADPVSGTGVYWQRGRVNAYRALLP